MEEGEMTQTGFVEASKKKDVAVIREGQLM